MTSLRCPSGFLLLALAALSCLAEEPAAPPEPVVHQVTGLFSPDREQDLRDIVAGLAEIKLVSVDFARAEARFLYDPAKAFPGAKPEQIVERFDNLLRNNSRHTFGIKPVCTSRDDLQRIEIAIAGLDCKACSFAAYEAVYRLEGVEHATASFKERLVTAWIHPGQTDRAKLEEALRKKQVELTAGQGVDSE